MRLYIKQKVFSLTQKTVIKDDAGYDRYYAQAELISVGRKMHVYNAAGNEVALIKQKVFTLLPKFEILINGMVVAEVMKKFTFFSPSYILTGVNWSIKGEFTQHSYEITDNYNNTVVWVKKAWFSWGDSYEVNILRDSDAVLAIAIVLAIDCVLDNQEK